MQRPGTSLLVIDDDDKVRHSIAIHLEQCGFEVLQAGTARDGLTLMASEQPELVLCDLQIEDASMSGIDLLSRLGEDRKSTRLNSSHVKISYAVFCLKKKTTATARAG